MNTHYCIWIITLTVGMISTPGHGARPWWDDGKPSYPSTTPPSPPSARSPSAPSPWWEERKPPSFPEGIGPFPRDNTLPGPNGEMWGMFLFGGEPHVMERWMDRMEYWGDRMENWADRWQGQGDGSWNRSNPLRYLNPNPSTDGYEPWLDPALMPWLNRWGDW